MDGQQGRLSPWSFYFGLNCTDTFAREHLLRLREWQFGAGWTTTEDLERRRQLADSANTR